MGYHLRRKHNLHESHQVEVQSSTSSQQSTICKYFPSVDISFEATIARMIGVQIEEPSPQSDILSHGPLLAKVHKAIKINSSSVNKETPAEMVDPY